MNVFKDKLKMYASDGAIKRAVTVSGRLFFFDFFFILISSRQLLYFSPKILPSDYFAHYTDLVSGVLHFKVMTRFCSDSDSFLGPFPNMFSQVGMAKCAFFLLFCSWPFSLDTSQQLQHCLYMETIALAILSELCFCSVSNIQYDFRMSRLIQFMLRIIIISARASICDVMVPHWCHLAIMARSRDWNKILYIKSA